MELWKTEDLKIFKECWYSGVGITLESVYDSAIGVYTKAFISYNRATTPAPNVLAAYVFGTGIFHRHIEPQNRHQPHTLCI